MLNPVPLLNEYDRCQREAPPPPRILQVRMTRTYVGARVSRPIVPVRWAVQFFIRAHIFRTIDALERGYKKSLALEDYGSRNPSGRATRRPRTKQLEQGLIQIERYREALGKPPPYRFFVLLIIILSFLAGSLLVGLLPLPMKEEQEHFFSDLSAPLLRIPPDLGGLWDAAVEADADGVVTETAGPTGEPGDERPDAADAKVIGFSMLTILVLVYVFLRALPIGAYQIACMELGKFRSQNQGSFVVIDEQEPAVRGAYAAERELFTDLNTPPPRDIAFDVLRSALLVVLCLVVLLIVCVIVGVAVVQGRTAIGLLSGFHISAFFWPTAVLALLLLRVVSLWEVAHVRGGRLPKPSGGGAPDTSRFRTRGRVYLLRVLTAACVVLPLSIALLDQVEPVVFGSTALVLASIGVAMLWLAAPGPVPESAGALGRHEALYRRSRALGLASALGGVVCLVALEDPVIAVLAAIVISGAIGLAVVIERGRERRHGGRVLVPLSATALALLLLAGVLWWRGERVGPFPGGQEREALEHVPAQVKARSACYRPDYQWQVLDAVGIFCSPSRGIFVGYYFFDSPEAASRLYEHWTTLERSGCEPMSTTSFEGTGDSTSGHSRVACMVNSDGYPAVLWMDDHRRVLSWTVVGYPADDRRSRDAALAWGGLDLDP